MILMIRVILANNGVAELFGVGTQESPYLIEDADDWNTFASYVNSGTNAD